VGHSTVARILFACESPFSYDVCWSLLGSGNAPDDPGNPQYIIVDSVFSVSAPLSMPSSRLATLLAIQASDTLERSCPSLAVPFIAVEYIKIHHHSQIGQSLHERHLSGAMYSIVMMYEKLGLDLPVFGLLIDKRAVTIYIGGKSRERTVSICNILGTVFPEKQTNRLTTRMA
jgi:hypothetical protein